MKSKSVKWNIIGGGEIHYGEVISIGEGYRNHVVVLPTMNMV